MKKFLSTFFICLVLCGIGTFFFASLLISNIWYITVLISLILTILILVFSYYEERIEKLEKTVERMQRNEAGTGD